MIEPDGDWSWPAELTSEHDVADGLDEWVIQQTDGCLIGNRRRKQFVVKPAIPWSVYSDADGIHLECATQEVIHGRGFKAVR